MNGPTDPVAGDDFPEFSEPPRHKPAPDSAARAKPAAEKPDDSAQGQVDDLMARLRRERAEGKD